MHVSKKDIQRMPLSLASKRIPVKLQHFCLPHPKIPRWWFCYDFLFSSLLGEDEPILTSIFFKWVGGENPPTSGFIRYLGKILILTRIFFKRVETTN